MKQRTIRAHGGIGIWSRAESRLLERLKSGVCTAGIHDENFSLDMSRHNNGAKTNHKRDSATYDRRRSQDLSRHVSHNTIDR